MKVLIVGGGIGGLTAARTLSGAGHEVVVVEQSERFDPLGAGIVLAPNATQLLAAVDVDLAEAGAELRRTEIHDVQGRRLQRVDLDDFARTYGPTWAVPRPALHELLIRELEARVELKLGTVVTELEESSDGVRIRTSDGYEDRFDLVVGADGIGSSIREMVLGPVERRYSGTTCWRGVVPGWSLDAAIESWDGAARVGVVPLPGNAVYYFLVLTAPRHTAGPGTVDEVLRPFRHFGGAPARLFERLTELPPYHHDLDELDRPVWGTPRVLLLGDAAHAMTPNLGQGAAMAIEDAFVLEQSVRDGVDGALPRYEAARNGRVRTIQTQSRRIGSIAHTERHLQRRLRNLAFARRAHGGDAPAAVEARRAGPGARPDPDDGTLADPLNRRPSLQRERDPTDQLIVGCQSTDRMRRRASGFTLIELLVVIVILGVMSAVVVFAVSNLSSKSDAAACAADSRAVTNAEEAYHALNPGYANEADLVTHGQLRSPSTLHDVTLSGGSYEVVPVGKCAGSSSVAAPGPGVTVKLLASGGAGMSGAQVEYFNGSAWLPVGTTGTDGAAAADLPDGTYAFRVDYRGQLETIAATAVTTGSVVEVHTFPVTVAIAGGAGDHSGGAIAHLGNDGYWMTDDSTDGSGVAVLELLAGSYTFRADFSGQTNLIPGVDVAGPTTVGFPLTTVTVDVGEASAPVEHRANNGEWISDGATNGSGTITFDALEGDYTVRAVRSNGSTPQTTVSIGGGAVTVSL